ncbi:IucA/IucC family protein [Bacillus pseudomycoides]|uniref:Adhesin n=1 Tax=Bacillus pseudomycoides TaxID=64104 RepID=A0A2B6R535_9BACI|nr:IucA/IucC family protein [Bacillus pseudomycoides]PDY45134.1 adhesin [Bacillus pseudomycoides]PED70419.1 adhesin [Bacillus pseudomycoides]PEI40050.1 adhesin [Bacillus pseudomycoides]PEJ75949.1 adhesin [Bacillus pseudomycoides]PEM10570.1 adhesin [Bacillus pseudomycoides]
MHLHSIHSFEVEEQTLFSFLQQNHPPLHEIYKQNLSKGRNGILERLLSSVIRENISNLMDTVVTFQKSAKAFVSISAYRCPDYLLDYIHTHQKHFEKSSIIQALYFKKQDCYLLVPVQQMYAFERPIVNGPYMLISPSEQKEITHPNEVLALIFQEGWEGLSSYFHMFEEDLANSAANLSLACTFHEQSTEVSTLEAAAQTDDHYAFFEQLVIEGHPCHPGAKMRKGLNPEETIAYSAEFKNTIPLRFVAVHNKEVSTAFMKSQDWNPIIFSFEPVLKAEAEIRLDDRIDDYLLLPIHPWQTIHTLQELYKTEIEQKRIIIFDYEAPYVAGMSFRTVFPAQYDTSRPHYKLTTNVHLTGEVRTLSEQTIHNGPLMSNILQKIMKEDTSIDERRFIPIMERAGAHFLSANDSNIDMQTLRSENLACVIRDNVYSYINKDEWAIVGSALVASAHGVNQPLIVELIELYKAKHCLPLHDAIVSFIEKYVANALTGFIPLMVKYGIGLEGHLQNTVPVFKKDGTPDRLLVRDWEGIRVHRGRLQQAGIAITNFHHKSRILVDDEKSVRNKVFYSVMQNHFGELFIHVSRFYNIDEQLLWNIVKRVTKNIFLDLRQDSCYTKNATTDYDIFFAEKVDYKALTLMRMMGEAHSYFYVKVDNPLYK